MFSPLYPDVIIYQWLAAIGVNSNSSSSGTVSTSICPKGWSLPTANNSNDGSFTFLLTKYSLASVTLPSGTNATSNASVSPLFFPRAGYISTDDQYSFYVGRGGYYWSSTIYSTGSAYYLFFYDTTVSPSGSTYRYFGYPVRCLVN